MNGMRRRTAITAAVVLLLAACGGADDLEVDETPGSDTPPVDETGGDGDDEDTTDPAGSDSREITIATADAAERTGVAAEDIDLISFEMVTWSDGSLGCPDPDMMYTQALVEGYRIVLDAAGTELVYHGALGEDPFHCEEPSEPVS